MGALQFFFILDIYVDIDITNTQISRFTLTYSIVFCVMLKQNIKEFLFKSLPIKTVLIDFYKNQSTPVPVFITAIVV